MSGSSPTYTPPSQLPPADGFNLSDVYAKDEAGPGGSKTTKGLTGAQLVQGVAAQLAADDAPVTPATFGQAVTFFYEIGSAPCVPILF